MDEPNVSITIPVNDLQIGDQFWQGDVLLYTVTGKPRPWSGATRVEVQYVDGGRGEREWLSNPDITVQRAATES